MAISILTGLAALDTAINVGVNSGDMGQPIIGPLMTFLLTYPPHLSFSNTPLPLPMPLLLRPPLSAPIFPQVYAYGSEGSGWVDTRAGHSFLYQK